MTPHVSLIILNFNGTSDTIACLESLAGLEYASFHVIVIDNGSRAEEERALAAAINRFSFVHYVKNTENLGFAGGCNQGIHIAMEEFESSYIYLLNNDTVVDPNMLSRAVEVMEGHPQVGIVSSQSRLFSDPHLLDNAGHSFLDCGDTIPRGRLKPVSEYSKGEFVMGACGAGMLINAAVIEDVGLLSEEFFINFEDVDFCLRTIMYGWDCWYEPSSVIIHKVNASISKVRSYDFNVRSQLNQFRAYFYNMPLGVILMNSFSVLVRDLGVIGINLFCLRWKIVRVFLHARWKLLLELPRILRLRRKHRPHWKRSNGFILMHQKSFLPVYGGYFWDIIVEKKRSALE